MTVSYKKPQNIDFYYQMCFPLLKMQVGRQNDKYVYINLVNVVDQRPHIGGGWRGNKRRNLCISTVEIND